jgi:cation transport regulator
LTETAWKKPGAGSGKCDIGINAMPCDPTEDLLDSVKKSLPEKAQNILLAAYCNIWDTYKDTATRKGDASKEEVAFKEAWSTVKKKYGKKGR